MAKLDDIRALAESHAAEISRSTKTWTGYLDTAATLYRYDFPETLLIHAQRPEATACAELEIWNSRMGRWVNRGSKGIALIDDSGPRKRLRYVFDISDTHMVRGGKTPYIWQMEPQIRQEMAGYLMDTYGLEYDPDAPLSSVLMALARAQVNDSLEDAMDGIAYEVRGTYLEGHSVEDPVMAKAYLSWDDVSGRIRQLLAQGEYAPQSVLDAARENALTEHATALAYMERDLADGIAEIVFDDTSIFRGGFPDAVTKISEKLDDPVFLADLIERLEGLSMAYAESPEIMRFNFYNPDRMLAQFRQFSKEAVPFTARDGFGWQEHGIFITQEEADAFLASGGPYSDGRIATYSHFLRHEDTQERAEFLKNQYGTGGRSHALSGADDSYADYSAKGNSIPSRHDHGQGGTLSDLPDGIRLLCPVLL